VSYKIAVKEVEVLGENKYVDEHGHTECVAFVRQVTGAPKTTLWKQGKWVKDAKPFDIPRGTAIATFDANRKYPTDVFGKHAAIYLGHDDKRIIVLDQWRTQGKVKERPIWFNRPAGTKRSNDGDTFYVIE
jgi:hypothetical protein